MGKRNAESSTDNIAAAAAITAHGAAERSGLPPADCYRAAVAAWRWVHPEQKPADAAQEAVNVVLAAKVGWLPPPEE